MASVMLSNSIADGAPALTVAQRQLWLGQKLSPESPLYNMAFLFALSGEINVAHFKAAFQALTQCCDALRMVIEEVDGVPQQRVLGQLNYEMPVLDFRASIGKDQTNKRQTDKSRIDKDQTDERSALRDWAEERSKKAFTLSERLFDTALIQLGDGVVWYLNQHHLITDMVSLKRLYEVMAALYKQCCQDNIAQDNIAQNKPAPSISLPAYADVVLPVPTNRATQYWQKQQIEPCALYHRSAERPSLASNRLSFSLSPEQTAALKALSLTSEAAAFTPQLSLFNLVSGIVLAYLHRVSGQRHVAFATPAQGRPAAALKETIGVFIELFPLSVEVEPEETFATLLSKVSESSGKLLKYAQPGASEFAPNRDVNVVLNFLTAKIPDFAGHPVEAEWLHSGDSDPHHHLRILVHDFDDRGYLQFHFDFNNTLFEPALQARAIAHFSALIDAVMSDRTQPITQINLLSESEQTRLDTLSHSSPVEVYETVVQQFETQVAQTPEAIALTTHPISSPNHALTYQQLNTKANQLAHFLVQQNLIAPATPIGICLQRSPEMLIAIWAILKAGGFYVPIEPSYPQARISHILKDTQAQCVLTHSSLANRLDGTDGQITNNQITDHQKINSFNLDTLSLTDYPTHNLAVRPTLNQLAYCLYTSGSTGQPKGVEIEHRSLANYLQWAQRTYAKDEALTFPLFSPLSFDLTVTSLYLPLLSGGQVVIYPDGDGAIDFPLERVFQDNAVDAIKLTPSHLALVKDIPLPSRLKTLILGGEALKASLARAVVGHADVELYNEYGPTEATVGCMIQRFETDDQQHSVPIGKPAAGASIYLLDAQLNPVPMGDVGEIFIGGPGLARGYLGREALTAERFIEREGERLYRTGDAGRWDEAGRMQYLGRGDRQVKINGIRIELPEIEAAVSAHPAVSHCVVSVFEHKLAAYYVASGTLAASALRAFVSQRLPGNIRPAHFIEIKKIPLTLNGKVETKALPNPQSGSQFDATSDAFVAPQTNHEKTLQKIWETVLSVEPISILDDFFDIGGDSISAIQIAARVSDAGLSVSPNQIFQHPTIADLATVLREKSNEKTDSAISEDTELQPFSMTAIGDGQLDKLAALLDKADLSAGGDE